MKTPMTSMEIKPGEMQLQDLRTVWSGPVSLTLDGSAAEAVEAGKRTIAEVVGNHQVVYGVNTGFGLLANTRISDQDLTALQKNLVLSHSAGMGEYLDDHIVRLVMVLKVNSLARGYSGTGMEVLQALLELLNRQLYPCIPQKGSVGASGDLAPLAHMTAALLGEGSIRVQGKELPAAQVLGDHGIPLLELGPKEGLALLNGTQVSTALALDALFRTEELFNSALVVGVSGGNFHAEPVAFAADNLALCIAEIGALSERRTALLIDRHLSELPPFLVENGGLNSGFMMPQVTAAALASENKCLAHPASVDSLPTSANQEDHVSMATFAARRLGDMAVNTAGILAVEYLCAAQGIDFRKPLRTSPPLEKAVSELRREVPFYDRDRNHAPDMEKAKRIIEKGYLDSILDHNIFA
jgi:histidine ammonia-lyase